MKSILTLVAAAGLVAPGLAQSAPTATEPCLHMQTSFDLLVRLPLAETAPLFGPNGERAWAGKHWNPEFVHPQAESTQAASDVEGAVFMIRHKTYAATWVTTLFDVNARHFQYVYFVPDLMVTVIDVRFKPVSHDTTGVNVVYTRTAITTQGSEHVAAMSEGDKTAGKEWQAAIDEYLAHTKTSGNP
jgi:hypothetical protein